MQGQFAAILHFFKQITGYLDGFAFEISQYQNVCLRRFFDNAPDFSFELEWFTFEAVVLGPVMPLDLAIG